MKRVAIWSGALLLGAMVPALIIGVAGRDLYAGQMFFVLGLAHVIVFGIPAAIVFCCRRWTSAIAAIVGAALIAMVPVGTFYSPLLQVEKNAEFGWPQYPQLLGIAGAMGAIGGLAFWMTLKLAGQLKP